MENNSTDKKQKANNFVISMKTKWREMKNLISPELGEKIFRVIKLTLIITTFLIIPILFTTLSTLMGAKTISAAAYYGVFYTVISLYILLVILLLFFNEYKK